MSRYRRDTGEESALETSEAVCIGLFDRSRLFVGAQGPRVGSPRTRANDRHLSESRKRLVAVAGSRRRRRWLGSESEVRRVDNARQWRG